MEPKPNLALHFEDPRARALASILLESCQDGEVLVEGLLTRMRHPINAGSPDLAVPFLERLAVLYGLNVDFSTLP